MPNKRGRISKAEDKQIANFLKDGISNEDIAKWLNRPVAQIEQHVKKFYGKGDDLPAKAVETAEFLRQLRDSSHWKFLREQYDGDELDYYEELYAQLMAQFKDDILPTEELQILQALDTVIMINRHKRSRKMVEDHIVELENKIQTSVYGDPNIATWESQKQALISQSNARTRDFTELAKKFDETIGKLKGTREQRIKNIESSKKSWTSLIKSLQERQIREQEGRRMELMKFATGVAAEKLQQPHKYINNEIDQPMLVPENILVERHGDLEVIPGVLEETRPVGDEDVVEIEVKAT